ncbi:hypothetical protein PAXRUDRAFT_823252 [Paxillus rubicundulus Ve08.2h10]|uniref:DUF6533 domain-containing protein n=1 Tax=Paxillus rubicundulus Ve08.2h10 TaxID=930991 RepID=A0A0D0DKI5_9AGAM|nr:hypothetical protein PAXRUDRAFT_823252 [Paxillus rubicundulus Ve08.2h10]
MVQPSTYALSIRDFSSDFSNTHDTNMVAFVGLTVLVWDHFITIVDEVELIWSRDKGLVAYLFLINRYLTPLGFIVNLVAFLLPTWGTEVSCKHFVKYEGAMTTIGIQIAGLMMFLRIRAMYYNKRAVVWSVMLVFLVWVGVNAWLLTHGTAVNHALGIHSCSMVFDDSLHRNIASASAWLPLTYDTLIFVLVLNKTKPALQQETAGHIIRTLYADGIMYYSLIFVINLILTIMIAHAPVGLQNITAQLELLLTVAMMSRITLNLRKQALYGPTPTGSSADPISRDWPHLGPHTRRRFGLDAHCLDNLTLSNNPAPYSKPMRPSTTVPTGTTPQTMPPATATPTRQAPWERPIPTTCSPRKDVEAL